MSQDTVDDVNQQEDDLDLNSNNTKVILNISDINEYPLLECTNEIYLTSPSSPKNLRSTSVNPLIIRNKDQTLLSSTSSFFHDLDYTENNALMETYKANKSNDRVNSEMKQQTTPCVNNQASILFINSEFSGCKESTPFIEGNAEERREKELVDCSEVEATGEDQMEPIDQIDQAKIVKNNEDLCQKNFRVKTILPQLMDRSLKEVNFNIDTVADDVTYTEAIDVQPCPTVDIKNNSSRLVSNLELTDLPCSIKADTRNLSVSSSHISINSDTVTADTQTENQKKKITQTIQSPELETDLNQAPLNNDLEIGDSDMVRAEINLQNLMEVDYYEKITVVEVFRNEVDYFVRKSGVGGRAEYAGRLSRGTKLVESKLKRARIDRDEFDRGVDECNRSYRGLGSALTEIETQIMIEGQPEALEATKSNGETLYGKQTTKPYKILRESSSNGSNRGTEICAEPRESPIRSAKKGSVRSQLSSRKKRQNYSTDESDLDDYEPKSVSPNKKRYKTNTQSPKSASFSFASLRINLSPNRKSKSLETSKTFNEMDCEEEKSINEISVNGQNEETEIKKNTSDLNIQQADTKNSNNESSSGNKSISSETSPSIKNFNKPGLHKCQVSVNRDKAIDSLVSLTSTDLILIDPKGQIKIIKKEDSSTANPVANLSPITPKSIKKTRNKTASIIITPSRQLKQVNNLKTPVTNKTPEFNVGDYVFTKNNESNEYWPSIVRKIRNNIPEKPRQPYKTFCCEFIATDMSNVFSEFSEACNLIKYDRLIKNDRVRVWSNSSKKYCNAIFVDSCIEEAMLPSHKTKNIEVFFNVKLLSNGFIKKSHIRDICIQEDTFLCISTREHKYSPKEKPSIDTSELNNFSDTCNRNNFQYDPNDTTNSEDIVILE